MFSGNRKVRTRRPKTAQDLGRQPDPTTPAATRGQTRQLSKRGDELNSQIHRLECFIADAPRLQRQQRLANVNMVPPLDLPSPARSRAPRRVPIAQRRAQRGQRLMLLGEFAFLLGAIGALVGWLNQAYHFWP